MTLGEGRESLPGALESPVTVVRRVQTLLVNQSTLMVNPHLAGPTSLGSSFVVISGRQVPKVTGQKSEPVSC